MFFDTSLRSAATVLLSGLAIALASPASVGAQTEGPDPVALADFSGMVREKLPAVVGIVATAAPVEQAPQATPQLPPGFGDFFGLPAPGTPPPGPRRALGSGFFISADGYVVTNNHVIAGAEDIEVTLEDDRRLPARLVGADPATDIALLKVDTEGTLPHVTWGASEDLEVGEWVVAMGNPFGLGGTVTAGIVSARSRDINTGPYDDFLQTDAAINSGNSGGPLFDVSGRVVGVNTAIFSPTGGNVGIGFAVPSQVAARIVDDLRDDGRVERGWLGVQIQPVTDDLAEALGLDAAEGALVSEVTPGSPAAEAGLEPGMVITGVSGESVDSPRDLAFAVADLAIGEETTVTVFEDATTRDIAVTIAAQPGAEAAATAPAEAEPETPRIGVSVAPLTAELRREYGLPGNVSGVVVSSVAPSGPAAEAGLRAGDVIVAAGGTTLNTVEDLQAAVAEAGEEPLLLRVFSNGAYVFRAVTPRAPDG